MCKEDKKNKEVDPMNVDKGVDLEEQAVEGGFFPTTADSSRANDLDAVSYEDAHQVFGAEVVEGEDVEEDTPGPADNVDIENDEDVEA